MKVTALTLKKHFIVILVSVLMVTPFLMVKTSAASSTSGYANVTTYYINEDVSDDYYYDGSSGSTVYSATFITNIHLTTSCTGYIVLQWSWSSSGFDVPSYVVEGATVNSETIGAKYIILSLAVTEDVTDIYIQGGLIGYGYFVECELDSAYLTASDSTIDTIETSVSNIEADLDTIISDLSSISDSVSDLYTVVSSIYSDIDTLIDTISWTSWSGSYDFGGTSSISSWNTITANGSNRYTYTGIRFTSAITSFAEYLVWLHIPINKSSSTDTYVYLIDYANNLYDLTDKCYTITRRFYVDVFLYVPVGFNGSTNKICVNGSTYDYYSFGYSVKYLPSTDIEYWQLLSYFTAREQLEETQTISTYVQNIYNLLFDDDGASDEAVSTADQLDDTVSEYQGIESSFTADFSTDIDSITSNSSWDISSFATTVTWFSSQLQYIYDYSGDFQLLFTLPMLLGIALFFIGRGHMVGGAYETERFTITEDLSDYMDKKEGVTRTLTKTRTQRKRMKG